MEKIGQRMSPTSTGGDPTGEDLFNIEPQSFLVIGSLDEFYADHGVNVSKFRSFELYRRNTSRPEIVTFDELLERARFIAEHGPTEYVPDPRNDDDIPF
ncbi:Shedu anti-phage system protein SduA domain-containing protein [Parasphingorhabdus sp.]|uniref:Shedu anti-phage system protein SduA domain-containing protein n=1 Tax=Parasphingorhabdus sp. TaxID=2709688 RepID=UPI0039C9EC1B